MELLLVGDVGDAGERARSLCEECGWHTTITPLRSSMEGGGVVSLEHVSAGRGDGWQVVAQGGTARVFGTIEEALTHLNETLLQPQISAPSAGALVPSLDLFGPAIDAVSEFFGQAPSGVVKRPRLRCARACLRACLCPHAAHSGAQQ